MLSGHGRADDRKSQPGQGRRRREQESARYRGDGQRADGGQPGERDHLDGAEGTGERYPFRAVRGYVAIALSRGWFAPGEAAATQAIARGVGVADQNHGRHEYRRAIHAAGWAYSDSSSRDARRYSRGNHADDLWRKPGDAVARKEHQAAHAARVGSGSGARGFAGEVGGEAAWTVFGDWANRQRQDDHPVLDHAGDLFAGIEDADHRRSGRI